MAELDGLRGLAALTIAIYHLHPQDFAVGWPKVDLFFVLSGYLITGVILKYQPSGGFRGRFFVRRALRTWPPYFFALAAIVLLNPRLPNPCRLDGLPYFLTFTQNVPRYWGAEPPPFDLYFLHTWSLALEEQFYLIWPVMVGLAGGRRLVPLCLLIAAGAVAARVMGFHPWLLAARCDGFALGGLLAALLRDPVRVGRHREAFGRGFAVVGLGALAYLLGGLAAFGGDAFTRPEIVWPGPTILATNLLYCGIVGLLVSHAGHPALGWLRGRALGALGAISYGIFLFHPLAFAATALAYRRFGPGEPRWLDPIKLAACLLAACLSWVLLERPSLRLKARFPYRPRP